MGQPVTQVELVTTASNKSELLCSTCLFYDPLDPKNGVCRRYPPDVPNNAFPKVKVTDWCGEHMVLKN